MEIRKKNTPFDWILIGFIMHSFGGLFLNSSSITCYTVCGLGLGIVIINGFFRSSRSKPFNGSIYLLFCMYLLWNLFVLIRPFLNEQPFSREGYSLINRFTWLSFTTPLIVFIGLKQISIESIFKFSFLQTIVGIILFAVNFKSILSTSQNSGSDEYQVSIGAINTPLLFLSASSFMVLCSQFIPSKYRIISLSSILLSFFTALYTARRGSVFMYLLILIFAFYMYVISSNKGSKALKFLGIAILLLLGFVFFNTYKGSTFSFFLSRLDEDTRSVVEESFYYSFHGETRDWIIGRGINGMYYSFIGENPLRGEIETGYLHMILKGGIIYLVFFTFFLAHSAYLGFFRAKNTLTKAMALYLIAHIIFLVPFGLPAFDFEYLVVWVCILFCQSKEFRTFSDSKIRSNLFNKKSQSLA